MAQAVNVNFKLDPDTKKSFEEVCSEMGLSVSAALTVFVKKVRRESASPSRSTQTHSIRRAISAIWKASCGTSKAERRTSRSMN